MTFDEICIQACKNADKDLQLAGLRTSRQKALLKGDQAEAERLTELIYKVRYTD